MFLKPLKGNTNIGGKLSCHQIGVRSLFFFCIVCYNLSEICSFLSLNMDFSKANCADPYEMTHRVTFYLGLPCSIKYPIRSFWYTKGIQRLISYIRVQNLPCLQRIKFVIAFIVEGSHLFCQMMSGLREDSNSFLICQWSRPWLSCF